MTIESLPSGSQEEHDEASFRSVFARALQGHPCAVVRLGDNERTRLPVGTWVAEAGDTDRELLDHCVGSTVDVGCGPGRMSAQLCKLGHDVLGVDVVHHAVRQARERGVPAIVRNVFDRLPGEGRWESALLADGNIGIGGDPVALLRRVGELVAPGGRVVVELAPRGAGLRSGWAALECDGARSRPFRWSLVGAEVLPQVAAYAGLTVAEPAHTHGSRFCAVLVRRP